MPLGSVSPATLEKLIKKNSSKRQQQRSNVDRRGSQSKSKLSDSKIEQINNDIKKRASTMSLDQA